MFAPRRLGPGMLVLQIVGRAGGLGVFYYFSLPCVDAHNGCRITIGKGSHVRAGHAIGQNENQVQ